ncbi:hypothetical protein DsansV1_C04g0038321 [Dioscorea sansibarensis]
MGYVGSRNGPRVFLTGHCVSKAVLNARRHGFVNNAFADLYDVGIKERILAARRQLYELKARYIELYARWHGRVDNGLMQLFQRDDDFYSNADAMEAIFALEREVNEFEAYSIEQMNLIRSEMDALTRRVIEASKHHVPAAGQATKEDIHGKEQLTLDNSSDISSLVTVEQIEPGTEMPLKTQKRVTKRRRDEASKKTRKRKEDKKVRCKRKKLF